MAVRSGKNGTAVFASTNVDELTNWTMDVQGEDHVYASDKTSGLKRHVVGTVDYTGTITVKSDAGAPQLNTGDAGALVLKEDASDSWSFAAAVIVSGPRTEVDLDTGDIVGYEYGWANAGAVTKPC